MGDAAESATLTSWYVAVAPVKTDDGWSGDPVTDSGIKSRYEHVELVEALTRVYNTDAHVVGYLVDSPARFQPRVNKPRAAEFPRGMYTYVLFADIDNRDENDNKIPMTLEQVPGIPIETEGLFLTRNGYRLVQPLVAPIKSLDAEPYIASWFRSLEARGIAVDWACFPWNHHFRLPNFVDPVSGKRVSTIHMDLSRMRPISVELDEEARSPTPKRGKGRKKPAAPAAPVAFTPRDMPRSLRGQADDAGRKLVDLVSAGKRHVFSLAFAGAFLELGGAPADCPAFVYQATCSGGFDNPLHHEKNARDTVVAWMAGRDMTGLRALREHWPAAAAQFEIVMRRQAEAELPCLEVIEPPPIPTPEKMHDVFRHASWGTTLLESGCGLGKTRTASEVAIERARKVHSDPESTATRAPDDSKTAISVDKHSLAIQITKNIRAAGVDVRRLYGHLSVVDDGCKYRESAEPWAAAGQSVQFDFCEGRDNERCQFYDGCKARLGSDGPHDARVVIGPHAMLSALSAAAGKTGILVIDEPPPLVETVTLNEAELALAATQLRNFETKYAETMRQILEQFRAWLTNAEAVPDLALLRAAAPEETTAPITDAAAYLARTNPPFAAATSAAAKTMSLIVRALRTCGFERNIERREGPDGQGADAQAVLVVSVLSERLLGALTRDGATVVADAAASMFAHQYERAVGQGKLTVHKYLATDGCTVARTLFAINATRTKFGVASRKLTPLVVSMLTRVMVWAGGGSLAIATFKALEEPVKHWVEAYGYTGEWAVGHYGGLDGLDDWKDFDALCTFGDPRPNMVAAAREGLYAAPDGDEAAVGARRSEDLARAELEQAHGRLRLVHRTKSARAAHVGLLWPRGFGWEPGSVEIVICDRGGVPKSAVTKAQCQEAMDLRDHNATAAGEYLGISRRTLNRILNGE